MVAGKKVKAGKDGGAGGTEAQGGKGEGVGGEEGRKIWGRTKRDGVMCEVGSRGRGGGAMMIGLRVTDQVKKRVGRSGRVEVGKGEEGVAGGRVGRGLEKVGIEERGGRGLTVETGIEAIRRRRGTQIGRAKEEGGRAGMGVQRSLGEVGRKEARGAGLAVGTSTGASTGQGRGTQTGRAKVRIGTAGMGKWRNLGEVRIKGRKERGQLVGTSREVRIGKGRGTQIGRVKVEQGEAGRRGRRGWMQQTLTGGSWR